MGMLLKNQNSEVLPGHHILWSIFSKRKFSQVRHTELVSVHGLINLSGASFPEVNQEKYEIWPVAW